MLFITLLIFAIIVYILFKSSNQYINNSDVPNKNSTEDSTSIYWEVIRKNTSRWYELGFDKKDSFPGYGKIYRREIEMWYCDVGHKEKKDVQRFSDISVLHGDPDETVKIAGDDVYFEELQITKEYQNLHSGLDAINRKRWYWAIINAYPTGIETSSYSELKEMYDRQIVVPLGWKLVIENSEDWIKHGFGNNAPHPSYGKVYNRIFDVWFCEIGSKVESPMEEFKDRSELYYYRNLFDEYIGTDKYYDWSSLSNPKKYILLISLVDKSTRKHWYFGLKNAEPTFIFTHPKPRFDSPKIIFK